MEHIPGTATSVSFFTVKVDAGKLSYMKNGKDMGVMFSNLPQDKPLCIATALWSPYSAVELMWEETNNPLNTPAPTHGVSEVLVIPIPVPIE